MPTDMLLLASVHQMSLNVNTVTGAEKTSTEQLDMFEHDHTYNCCYWV